jgi:uncharacterized membrane protein
LKVLAKLQWMRHRLIWFLKTPCWFFYRDEVLFTAASAFKIAAVVAAMPTAEFAFGFKRAFGALATFVP